jgi:RNA polymerase sigma-70 factor (ECF subfamily)
MQAFDEIYHKYNKLLFGFAIRIVKFSHDAEDIVHDVFLKLWQNRTSIDEEMSFRSYLFTIAYNTTINIIRKRSVKEEYVEALKNLQDQGTNNVATEMEFNELNEKLQSALNELPQRQKEIYMLSRDEGLTYSQIAEKLSISVNTVENHMVKALKFLRTRIDTTSIMATLFWYLFV